MNREIKFRGLRDTESGGVEMVYGQVSMDSNQDCVYYKTHPDRIHWRTESGGHASAPVRKGTAGQYTGLKDKNGTPIYEGDIVAKEEIYHFIDREGWKPREGNWIIIGEKTKNFTGKQEEKYIAGYHNPMVIEWSLESAGYEPFSDSKKNCGHCGGGDDPEDYIVLGNIHEHPELLNKNTNETQ